MRYFCIIAFTVLTHNLSFSQTYEDENDTSTLELVHVIFRHGNRTVDLNYLYPKDPYINETYYPYGYGQLTNRGKQKMYTIGKALRTRYNSFLGDVYTLDVLDAVCTEMNRTKMSLALLLASLYPPKGTILNWDEDLDWQPIPYNYLLFANDHHLLSFAFQFCPKYIPLYQKYMTSPLGLETQQKYETLFSYLSEHTGVNVTSFIMVLMVHVTLVAQEDWGFKLPTWTEKVYPEALDKAAGEFFATSSATPELKQLTGGFHLKKIISDTRAKIEKTLTPENRKLFLYSAHDANVAYILSALNVFIPHEPTFGAYVVIELHKIKNVHGIKIFYQDFAQLEPKLLTVPDCTQFCPFDKFVELLQENLPSDDNPCGDK